MKRLFCLLLVVALAFGAAPLGASAASAANGSVALQLNNDGAAELIDADGAVRAVSDPASSDAGSFKFEAAPDQTLYLCLGVSDGGDTSMLWNDSVGDLTGAASPGELADQELFKLKVSRDGDGARLVRVSQYNERAIGGSARSAWLKIDIAASDSIDEQKAVVDLTFTARDDDENGKWEKGDYALLRLTLWIGSAVEEGGDALRAAGDSFVYKPDSNSENIVTWEDVASLSFSASDDAKKFYARLSTKHDPIYAAYEDSADLYFRNFTGAPTISASSRATLTLYYPWEDGGPDPAACHVYLADADGSLRDVTKLFTYIGEDEDGSAVNGWRIRTRTLGCYIITDRALDLTLQQEQAVQTQPETVSVSEQASVPPASENAAALPFDINRNAKPIPNTGI